MSNRYLAYYKYHWVAPAGALHYLLEKISDNNFIILEAYINNRFKDEKFFTTENTHNDWIIKPAYTPNDAVKELIKECKKP